MKKKLFLAAICSLMTFGGLTAQTMAPTGGPENYRLKKIMQVEGRQGIAADKDYYYVTSSTEIFKYDKNGKLLAKNATPFKGFTKEVNHFGDIDVYDGKIYTGVEWFVDGVGKNIQIAIYDANTLEYKSSINFNPESGQTEVCGISIDKQRGMAWMADWVNGKYLYRYDLKSGEYLGKVHIRPVPQYQQGVFYCDGKILISSDDGDADYHETDNIYVADVSNMAKTDTYVNLWKECTEFVRAGEIEGLCIDPANDDFLVLTNRGSRIILGMVRGFYDGYDKEIHEVYIYERINKNCN